MNTNINELNSRENLLSSLSEKEREIAMKILEEFGTSGKSDTYTELLYREFKEIPVDIETFLTDDRYLGKPWKDAKGNSKVYPFWMEVLKKIFPDNLTTDYDTLLESGARGIGKSEMACGVIAPYLMYRVLCMKNPMEYFHIKSTEKIAFAFLNIKIDLAEAIAKDKFQKNIQMSPWFMSRGTMTKRDNSPYWIPPEPIELIIGSQSDDVIGRPIFFCLDGDTKICTDLGTYKIKDLVDKQIKVPTINNYGAVELSETCTVKETGVSSVEYQIELDDGSIIKCTPNHRFMLKDGTYKEAQYLTEDDELFDCNVTYKGFIDNIIKSRGQWNIPEGEYFEVHHIIPKCLGGEGDIRKGRKLQQHPNLIYLYPREHFIAHKLLALENSDNPKLVYAWSMMAFPKGKTRRDIELTPEEYEELRRLQSQVRAGKPLPEYAKNKLSLINKGKKLSQETKDKIAKGNKGKTVSQETRLKMSNSARLIDRSNYKTLEGRVCITNGSQIRFIDKNETLPENWYYGNCKTSGKHNMDNYYSNKDMIARRKELSSGTNNPNYGKGIKVSGGNNGNAKYIYTYKDIDYLCRDDLMVVLKQEFPEISESTIRRIMKNKYSTRTSSKYQYVIDNLTWRLKKDEN